MVIQDLTSDRPLIGITMQIASSESGRRRFELSQTYLDAIDAAGGIGVPVPPIEANLDAWLAICDGWLLSGGNDPRMEPFGVTTHPEAKLVDPQRQAFEMALLGRLDACDSRPVLGVCLGAQFMALHAGGMIDQHLPDRLPTAPTHQDDRRHGIRLEHRPAWLEAAAEPSTFEVISNHHQGISDVGRLRIVGRAEDGVIEMLDDPDRDFYIGVQWHPERGGEGPLNLGLLRAFVLAGRRARNRPAGSPRRPEAQHRRH
ncbi:MAG: gamma-glutamyl-gamma-aminobutyrate hydrolase family protein [Phycisphaeraceae bacterium]|nr:gamma-glutamyl-gamma-aminobutyrate hydrolase family protein [Phycisphaeraceae bacterium]